MEKVPVMCQRSYGVTAQRLPERIRREKAATMQPGASEVVCAEKMYAIAYAAIAGRWIARQYVRHSTILPACSFSDRRMFAMSAETGGNANRTGRIS